jgi:hypothetical protein
MNVPCRNQPSDHATAKSGSSKRPVVLTMALPAPRNLIRINGTVARFPRVPAQESVMTGIALTAEQIRNAPALVRQRIANEVVAA